MNVVDYRTKCNIPEEKIEAMKVRGYDIFVYKNGKPIFINSKEWNEDKADKLYVEYKLLSFYEEISDDKDNLVIYDPEYFEVFRSFVDQRIYLHCRNKDFVEVFLPANCSTMCNMFMGNDTEVVDFSKCDLSNIISMEDIFAASHVHTVIFGEQNFNKLKIIDSAFQMSDLENTDMTEQYLPNLESAKACFRDCNRLERLDISKWRSKNLNATSLVSECDFLESLNCEGVQISVATNMCQQCKNLKNLVLGDITIGRGNVVFKDCERLYALVNSFEDEDIIKFFKELKDAKDNDLGKFFSMLQSVVEVNSFNS